MGGSTSRASVRLKARRIVLGVIALLYVISVPWYRSSADDVDLVVGLPDWVAVALACYVGVAVLNALAWWLTDVPDAETHDGDAGSS